MAALLAVEEACGRPSRARSPWPPRRRRSPSPRAAASRETRAPPSTCRRSQLGDGRLRRSRGEGVACRRSHRRRPACAARARAGQAMATAREHRPGRCRRRVPVELVVESDNDAIEIAGRLSGRARSTARRGSRRGRPRRARGNASAAGGAQARSPPPAWRRARVRGARATVVSTGTELRPPGESLEPGQSSKRTARCSRPRSPPRARSSRRRRSPTTSPATGPSSSAGFGPTCSSHRAASRRAADLVRKIEAELGAEEVFWRGRRQALASRSRSASGAATLVFGLPGNPVSSLVCFELFVRPAVLALQGARGARAARSRQGDAGGRRPAKPRARRVPCARDSRVEARRVPCSSR